MRMLSLPLLSLLFVTLLQGPAMAQNPTRARTEGGKEVLLYSNGTWKYAEEKKGAATADKGHSKPASAQTPFKTARGNFEIWVDENKWSKTGDEPGRLTFKLKTGDAYAMVISEEIAIGIASLKEIAIENAKKAGSDFVLLADDNRMVNGRQVASNEIQHNRSDNSVHVLWLLLRRQGGDDSGVVLHGAELVR
jgi:hypothetical protein